ncbi:MAG: threonine synthase [Solobacterium sp.]|nr:threonine synthase [Solobacterium sp.]
MRYLSTRNRNITSSAHMSVIKGLADDGGLFVPETIDIKISISDFIGLTYRQTAERILSAFLDDYTPEEISACVAGAYDGKFDTPDIVPVTGISDGWLMELWHGPTSAFKDIALTILPRLLTAAYKKENLADTISILTATSGDTGKAALSGFADVEHTAVTVFYPEEGVSAVQKKQMQTSRGDNVCVIAVKGNFDDCQRMVKQACSDPKVLDSCRHVRISSANSINVGRLIPQVVYYITSYAALVRKGALRCGDPVNFVVPTGNFGDILAGWLAKKIGLPVNRLICASNSNNVLTDFLRTGTYSTDRPFRLTMSPSMDILISSNLERLLFMISDGDDQFTASCMKQLQEKGSYTVSEEILQRIRKDFDAYWTDEQQCRDTISELYKNEGVLIDPHTAVALHAMRQYRQADSSCPSIVLSTASPFKFCRDVLSCISDDVPEDEFEAMKKLSEKTGLPVPSGLAELETLPVRFTGSIEVSEGIDAIAERMRQLSHD